MYYIQHHAYCGMSGLRHDADDLQDARNMAARKLRAYRRRYSVVTLDPGREWEILEPDNCAMVPDACGTLAIHHITYECNGCDFHHESKDDAARCCAETFEEYRDHN